MSKTSKKTATADTPKSQPAKEKNDSTPKAEAAQAVPQKGPKKIDVKHLTRVEGHGNILVEINEQGEVTTCRWEVPEAPRFFEAMLMGRPYTDVHQITSRICGICSIGHQLASIQATEDALGIQPTNQTLALRKLALHAENLQSHFLHLAYLVLPDLLGVPSVVPLATTHKKELTGLIKLHRVANEFSRIICGRTTHPQRLIPGGFAKVPMARDLESVRDSLKNATAELTAAAELFASVRDKFPDFTRSTEFVALVSQAEYPLYWGQVGSTMDTRKPAHFYKDVTKEYLVPQSTAKWAKNQTASYMVGALARFNLNAERLSPFAKKVADMVGLKAPSMNPFHNNLAQLVECVHSFDDSMSLIDGLLDRGVRQEGWPKIDLRPGKGVGAVEVPRGLLFHSYEYDADGRITRADCVIPTNQNHANIQLDLESLAPEIADRGEDEIELILSMLVRAYDPCISCSTHYIDMRPGVAPSRGVTIRRV